MRSPDATDSLRNRAIYYLSRFPKHIISSVWPLFSLGVPHGSVYFYRARAYGREIFCGGIFGVNETFPNSSLTDFETEMARTVSSILPADEKGIILDVGANVGQSLLVFKSLCRDAAVISFEPVPSLAGFLNALIKINGFDDCRAVHVALNDGTKTEITFYHGTSETLTASAAIRRPLHNLEIIVPAMSLDSFIMKEKLGRVALVKIDVEGFEPDVIAGAAKFLAEKKPPIIMEILHSEGDAAWQEKHQTMESFLRGLGYRFYHIGKGGVLKEQADRLAPDPNYIFLNYLITTD